MSGPDSVPLQSLAFLALSKLEGREGSGSWQNQQAQPLSWESKKMLQQGACLVWTSDLQGDLSAAQSREPASSKISPHEPASSIFLVPQHKVHPVNRFFDALTIEITNILSATTFHLQVPPSPTIVPACKTSCIGSFRYSHGIIESTPLVYQAQREAEFPTPSTRSPAAAIWNTIGETH